MSIVISNWIVMIGKQAVKLCRQFFVVIFGKIKNACRACCKKDQLKKPAWEIDSDLEDFQSNTLLEEYMNISTNISRNRSSVNIDCSHSIRFYCHVCHSFSVSQ